MSIQNISLVTYGDGVSTQHLEGILGFRLVTADLGRLTRFYRDVLGFAAQGPVQPIDAGEMALLGLDGRGRRQVLSIGRQNVALDEFEAAGQPYPAESSAASLWFQHLALVVVDIAQAYARLREAAPISQGGPQHLPPETGGAHAFKFRDPDGHPLELLQFPPTGMPATWQGRTAYPGQLALGIDHSAISVGDADVSLDFYTALGLKSGKATYNKGPAQERLDDLENVEVEVTPMVPGVEPPHLELLAYHVPHARPVVPLQPNDVAATRVVWRGSAATLSRDPDGHLHQVEAGSTWEHAGRHPSTTMNRPPLAKQ
jgi:catechol 2,3-dioxygenase-like lactoylglutathione lyase family enzyme